MVLKYHDENKLLYEVFRENEILWISSVLKYKKDGEPFDLDTIEDLILSIQSYFYLGEQEVWIIEKYSLRTALDELSRVAYCLIKILKRQNILKVDLELMTERLLGVLYCIDRDMGNI
jgi:hypothetical protein